MQDSHLYFTLVPKYILRYNKYKMHEMIQRHNKYKMHEMI